MAVAAGSIPAGGVPPGGGGGITAISSPNDSLNVSTVGGVATITTAWVPDTFPASRTTPLVTSNPPASALEYLRLDNGAGGDILLPAGTTWKLNASIFTSTNNQNASVYIQLQYNINGGGWVDVPVKPVVKVLGNAQGAEAETAFGDFFAFLVGVPFQLRLVIALFSGPGGSEIRGDQAGIALNRKS